LCAAGTAKCRIGDEGTCQTERISWSTRRRLTPRDTGDNVLVTTVDTAGRQVAQVIIKADDACELVSILGSKLRDT
jgi:hypothetical protein